MTALREASQQALEFVTSERWGTTPYMDVCVYEDAARLREALRAALKHEEEASAWLAERKEYWRKEKEKIQATNALRAALAQQDERDWSLLEATQESLREHMAEIHRLRAALAQQAEPVAVAERERIAAQWDGCVAHQLDTFGPVDIGASIRAGELVEPAQQAEPVDGACLHGVDDGACKECYAANAEPVEQVLLTEEEIEHIGMTHQSLRQVVRAVEKASWEKNHAKGL